MTREEHIKILEEIKRNYLRATAYWDAIEAAIKALENHDTFMKYAYSQGKQDALEQQPCEDAISREAVHKLRKYVWVGGIQTVSLDDIDELPPVTPSRPKGRCNICKWYDEDGIYNPNCENCCRNYKDNYCGAEMVEPQESEDKE